MADNMVCTTDYLTGKEFCHVIKDYPKVAKAETKKADTTKAAKEEQVAKNEEAKQKSDELKKMTKTSDFRLPKALLEHKAGFPSF